MQALEAWDAGPRIQKVNTYLWAAGGFLGSTFIDPKLLSHHPFTLEYDKETERGIGSHHLALPSC